MVRIGVCNEAGCPNWTNGAGKCDECRRAVDLARGSRHQRGYDSRYTSVRNDVVADATECETCGEPFTTDNPATGGHRVDLRDGGTTDDGIFAQCRRCNYGWRRNTNE